jgi:3-phenylpropionate/cinnamic acid dioxygenase small subunit
VAQADDKGVMMNEHLTNAHRIVQGASASPTMTRLEAEDFLIHEARLIDDWQLEAWHALFAEDGIYWIPLDETQPVERSASIVRDTPLRREERLFHLTKNAFPAQSPRSRLLHFVSNVAVEPMGELMRVRSNQIIHEMRTGDFRQIGLGEVHAIAMSVEHHLRAVIDASGQPVWKIVLKKVLLLNRDGWLGNLTFIL